MEKKTRIDQLKRGDNEAFKALIDDYRVKVVNICYGYLHNRDEAEDIAQDVFVEVYHSINKFRGEADLKTWIYRIAVNKSLNRKKRMKRVSLFSSFGNRDDDTDPTPAPEPAEESPNAQQKLEQEEQRKTVQRVIDQLPENQKTAFILKKYEELSYKEIAEVMETTVSSVESLIFRAKSNVQKKLLQAIENENV
jgi:RNA polymerase sigma-70 factor (ECF subfamily)